MSHDEYSAVRGLCASEAGGARADPNHLTEVTAVHVFFAGKCVFINLAVPLVRRFGPYSSKNWNFLLYTVYYSCILYKYQEAENTRHQGVVRDPFHCNILASVFSVFRMHKLTARCDLISPALFIMSLNFKNIYTFIL